MTQDTRLNPLAAFARNVTSNGGEDGIIEKIFDIVGAENNWCVELGALDGVYDSNSWNLINNKGWSAVLIEAEERYVKKLTNLYSENKKVHVLHSFVSFEGRSSLDALLAKTPIPENFDLLVLDIDGNDYHVWNSLVQYRPRVVSIEFNFTVPNDIDFVQPRDMRVQQGSSLCAVERLARSKGYRLIDTTSSNAFFVNEPLFAQFGLADTSLDALHPDTRFHTRVFQLYDGTLMLAGYQRLFWHKKNFTSRDIQVLPEWRRTYPAKVASSALVRAIKNKTRTFYFYPRLLRLKQSLFGLGSKKDI